MYIVVVFVVFVLVDGVVAVVAVAVAVVATFRSRLAKNQPAQSKKKKEGATL